MSNVESWEMKKGKMDLLCLYLQIMDVSVAPCLGVAKDFPNLTFVKNICFFLAFRVYPAYMEFI